MAYDILGKPSTRHMVALFVPSTQNLCVGGKKVVIPVPPFVRLRFLNMVKIALSERFMGCTTELVQGSWVDSDNGTLVHEDIDKVYSLIADLTLEDIRFFYNLALVTKSAFNQDSVLLTIDEKGWFI